MFFIFGLGSSLEGDPVAESITLAVRAKMTFDTFAVSGDGGG